MKNKGLYRKLSISELKNIFGGEMLDDQGRKIVRKNLDGVYSIKDWSFKILTIIFLPFQPRLRMLVFCIRWHLV